MSWILRTSNDLNNPTLSGGVYGKYITIGKAVYWRHDGVQTRGVIFIADGGKFGLDKIDEFSYKGDPLDEGTNWIFHRGTFPAQIEPFEIDTVDDTTDVFTTVENHPFINGDLVRLRSIDGDLPQPLEIGILGHSAKYLIADKTATTFKLKTEDGLSYITLDSQGTGALIVWKADTGFDDAEQGLPTFVPEVETTFNNISHIEFMLPEELSSETEPPDWQDFRILGTGRRLMDYDEDGVELGVIEDDDDLLSNPALQIADNLFWNYKVKTERLDFPSWKQMRDASLVLIWQRADTSEDAEGTGLTARYYQNEDFTDLKVTRLDGEIDMGGSVTEPAPNVDINGFSVRWNGRIKPLYSETYTFTAIHDNSVKVWVNSQLIIDSAVVGTHTGEITLVEDELYDIQVELVQFTGTPPPTNPYECRLKWQSASQALEIVPASQLYPNDSQVRRYECDTAFNQPTEASEVHELIMDRIIGWDWTDDNGKIVFLPPDRPVAFAFHFDQIDDDSFANFANKSFEKRKRGLPDRKNFQLFRFREKQTLGYEYAFVQADREELRRLTNGEPSNDPASDLGVMNRSQAQRMAEMEMVLKSDPKHLAQILGGRASSKLRKNFIITATYYDTDGNFVIDERYVVTFHSWGASNDANQFSLLPIPENFYTDEPVIEE